MLVMFYHCFSPSGAAMNLHLFLYLLTLYLFAHDGKIGRYHNEPLDSLITILSHGSFLKIIMKKAPREMQALRAGCSKAV